MIFLKFWLFSEINKSFMIYLKFQKTLIASALGHADISKSTGAGPVKPDQWGPLVSDTTN